MQLSGLGSRALHAQHVPAAGSGQQGGGGVGQEPDGFRGRAVSSCKPVRSALAGAGAVRTSTPQPSAKNSDSVARRREGSARLCARQPLEKGIRVAGEKVKDLVPDEGRSPTVPSNRGERVFNYEPGIWRWLAAG